MHADFIDRSDAGRQLAVGWSSNAQTSTSDTSCHQSLLETNLPPLRPSVGRELGSSASGSEAHGVALRPSVQKPRPVVVVVVIVVAGRVMLEEGICLVAVLPKGTRQEYLAILNSGFVLCIVENKVGRSNEDLKLPLSHGSSSLFVD